MGRACLLNAPVVIDGTQQRHTTGLQPHGIYNHALGSSVSPSTPRPTLVFCSTLRLTLVWGSTLRLT